MQSCSWEFTEVIWGLTVVLTRVRISQSPALLWMVSGLTPVVTIVMYWSLINLNKYFYIWLPFAYVCSVLPVILPVPLCSGINQSQNGWGWWNPSGPAVPEFFLSSPCVFVQCWRDSSAVTPLTSCSFMSQFMAHVIKVTFRIGAGEEGNCMRFPEK